MRTKYRLKEEPIFGYKYLDPLPSKLKLKHFYAEKYSLKIQKEGRRKEARLIDKDSEIKKKELEWLEQTYFGDCLAIFSEFLPSCRRKILDIGCGSGDFLKFMKKFGWIVFGIEPSKDFFKEAKEKKIRVYNLSFEEFIDRKGTENKFNVIVLDNFLEHIPRPKETIMNCRKLLSPNGILYIKVPNDFNKLQLLAQRKVKKKQWWVASPDHINYFNFNALEKLLEFCGFEIFLRTTDFPMELFLLMGRIMSIILK